MKTWTNDYNQEDFSKHDTEYLNYYEDKLLRAGDVETHPGPSANYLATGTNHVHLLAISVLLILFLNKIQQYSGETANDSQKYLSEGLLSGANLLRLKTKHSCRTIPPISTSSATLTILLLMAGDVHPNPGHGSNIQCSTSGCTINEPTSLTCETCNNHYHLSCITGPYDQKATNIMEISFDWICPNLKCQPNHHHRDSSEMKSGQNRFNILGKEAIQNAKIEKGKSKRKRNSQKKCNPAVKMKKVTENRSKLLKELPKISSKDYIGKEICRCCLKEIRAKQQAIFCDLCDMWTHRSCSEMSIQTYNRLKKIKRFNWICKKCRKDDEVIGDKIDKSKLGKEHLPEPLEDIIKSSKELLIIHMNCRSLVNKEEELENIVNEIHPDIICLTETWFNESIPSQAFVPDNYNIIRKDRDEGFKQKYGRNRGGGVAVLFKKHIKVEQKSYLTDKVEEILWVQVKTRNSFMLGTIYRTEYADILNNDNSESILEKNIRKAAEITSNIIVTGDLNVDMIDLEAKDTQTLKDTFETYQLKQHITKATRVDKKSLKPTIIDHVWASSETNLIKNTGTFDGISDHMGIYMKLNQKPVAVPETKITFRSYKNYNPENFCQELTDNLESSNIEDHLKNNEVNLATEEFMKTIQETSQKYAPLVEIKSRNKRRGIPWFTEELKNMIRSKNELLQDYYTSGLEWYKKRLKVVNNNINYLKRSLKKTYINDQLEKAGKDSKEVWKVYNLITRRTKVKETKEPDLMNQQKADNYNKFFATVGLEIQKKLEETGQSLHKPDIPENSVTQNSSKATFAFEQETVLNIEKIIDNIRIEVAVGEDMIGAKLIKDMKSVISPILTRIVNKGYETDTFPDCMKKAVIKPIHKKGNVDEISNYRPISILPTLSKVFEKAAVNQLVTYLETNKLLHKSQHAYRKHHSTVTCLVEILNYIYRIIDNKKLTAIISLDLSKAFDSINHQLLITKLQKMGLGVTATNWVSSYLNNRKQTTKFRDFTSKEEGVHSGIPQGSIVGPLLFLCYTNDFHEEFDRVCNSFAYADDTQLIVEAINMQQLKRKIEDVVSIAQSWYHRNTMKNNIDKTEVLMIATNHKNEYIKISVKHEGKNIVITSKSHIEILGVIIDTNLNWRKQINEVRKKSFNITRNIHQVNHLLPLKSRLNLYHAVISPQFDYADVVWSGCGQKESKSLQRVQNFAAKSITGNRKYDSATESLMKLNLLNLQQRRSVHETVLVHKALQDKSSENINTLYQQHLSKSNTRQATHKKLSVPPHRTSKFEKSPLYRSITSWNQCPNIIDTESIQLHKKQLQKHILATTYSSKR